MFVQPLPSVVGANLLATATPTAVTGHTIKTEGIGLSLGHEGATEYECDFCDYKSPRRSNVNQHVKTVHERIRDFACEQCPYKSSRRSNLANHVKTVHDNIKDFLCRYCDFKSSRKYNIVQHINRVHRDDIGIGGAESGVDHQGKIKVELPTNPVTSNGPKATRWKRKKNAQKQQQQQNNVVTTINAQHIIQTQHLQPVPQHSIQTKVIPQFTLDPPTMVVTNPTSVNMPQIPNSQAQPQMNYAMSLNYDRSLNFSCGPLNPPVPSLNYLQPLTNIEHSVINVGPQFTQPQATYGIAPSPAQQVSQQVTVQTGPAGIQTVGAGKDEFHCQLCSYKCAKKKSLMNHLQNAHHLSGAAGKIVVQHQQQQQHQQPVQHQLQPQQLQHLQPQHQQHHIQHHNPQNQVLTQQHIILKPLTPALPTQPQPPTFVRDKNFGCQYCDFRTAYRRNLNSHVNEVHLKERREHKCHICDFKSTRRSNLTQHIKSIHERIRDHSCWLCGFTSSRKKNVEKHVMTMHIQKDDNHGGHSAAVLVNKIETR